MASKSVGIRDLRNSGGEVLERVRAGENIIVTKSGKPIAELRPIGHRALDRDVLLDRWRHLPQIDAAALRAETSQLLDESL